MDEWDTTTTTQKSLASPILDNWVEAFQFETVMIYGKPKSGKTFCYMSVIDEELKKDPTTKFYLLCSDNGASKTFLSYFGVNKEPLKNIEYHALTNPTEFKQTIQEIKKKAKRTDWIIVDLISSIWEMAQDHFVEQAAQAFGGDITEYVANSKSDNKKFGLLEAGKWQIIKRIDSIVTQDLINSPFCNIFACAGEKVTDMEVALIENAIAKGKDVEKPELLTLYDKVGAKPAGRKELSYYFSTITYIGGIENKYFQLIGDRGNMVIGEQVKYGRNFWKTFCEKYRKKV